MKARSLLGLSVREGRQEKYREYLKLNNMTMRFKVRRKTLPMVFDDKMTTHSFLSLETTGMFQDGRIRLRCFAEITPVYKASASKEIVEEGPYLASSTGDASPHSRRMFVQRNPCPLRYHSNFTTRSLVAQPQWTAIPNCLRSISEQEALKMVKVIEMSLQVDNMVVLLWNLLEKQFRICLMEL
ncbi:hypothetical protein TSAR_010662 [Trichomalopsis sarcophagae]|uniref:Uncharacterized protein n=1 Tax=Trichomalopsis sarcophagae TaxID=543379 RepID=A0A232FME5_9HYME|nr:hypothetical protein TSAR_010662 [Trichomalopsis sarcophagae]